MSSEKQAAVPLAALTQALVTDAATTSAGSSFEPGGEWYFLASAAGSAADFCEWPQWVDLLKKSVFQNLSNIDG